MTDRSIDIQDIDHDNDAQIKVLLTDPAAPQTLEDALNTFLPEHLRSSFSQNYQFIEKIYTKTVLPFLLKKRPGLKENHEDLIAVAQIIYLFINILILRSGFPEINVLEEFRTIYDERLSALKKPLRKFLEGDEEGEVGIMSELLPIVNQFLKEN